MRPAASILTDEGDGGSNPRTGYRNTSGKDMLVWFQHPEGRTFSWLRAGHGGKTRYLVPIQKLRVICFAETRGYKNYTVLGWRNVDEYEIAVNGCFKAVQRFVCEMEL